MDKLGRILGRSLSVKNTSLTALGGIVSSLSLFLMFLSGLIPNMTYVIPGITAILLICIIEEAELKWSFYIYIAVSVLSMLLVADKEAATMYVFFFGYYPIAKRLFETKLGRGLGLLAKFLTFNIMIVLGYLLIIYVFLIPVEGMEFLGKWTPLVLLGIGNIIFVIYDYVLSSLTVLYRNKLQSQVQKLFQFKR